MGVKGFHHGFCASLFCGFRERETKEMREREIPEQEKTWMDLLTEE